MSCVFCQIIDREKAAEIVYEDGNVVAFLDIQPKAPVHMLIVPRKHISSMKDITDQDCEVLCALLLASKKIAKDKNIDDGYKLVFNVGKRGGQIVDHVHLHVLGGF